MKWSGKNGGQPKEGDERNRKELDKERGRKG